jgi:protein NrfC
MRMVDERKCIGCQRCVEACPHKPSRAIWNFEKKHSQKCDLCANTPYWDEKGGPDGKQACVAVCPMKAIKFTKEIPNQTGEAGYDVNLRGPGWVAMMGGGSGGH